MDVAFDVFTEAFLQKITEFDLLELSAQQRGHLTDSYLTRALSELVPLCRGYFTVGVDAEHRKVVFGGKADSWDSLDSTEIVNIVSEGMLIHWLKPYVNRQESLENVVNTRDYSTYSPAELLKRVGERYKAAMRDFKQMALEYTYAHGDLTRLHL